MDESRAKSGSAMALSFCTLHVRDQRDITYGWEEAVEMQ
jgi:hypothetical protein